jgi:hypothetical protein
VSVPKVVSTISLSKSGFMISSGCMSFLLASIVFVPPATAGPRGR